MARDSSKRDIRQGGAELAMGAGAATAAMNHKTVIRLTNQANDAVYRLKTDDWVSRDPQSGARSKTIHRSRKFPSGAPYGMDESGSPMARPAPAKNAQLRSKVGRSGRPQPINPEDARAFLADYDRKKAAQEGRRRLSSYLNRQNQTHRRIGRALNTKGRIGLTGTGVVAGVPLIWHGAHKIASGMDKRNVDKRDTKHADDVNRAAAAGFGTIGVYQGAGFALKPTYERRLRHKINAMGDDFKAIEREHGKKVGLTGKERIGDPKYLKFYRTYPKELPGWKYRRTLSYTHGGKTQMALAGSLATAAAVANVKRGRRKDALEKAMGEYPYLLPTIREDVIGIPETRTNPISPLQMLAASNISAEGLLKVRSRNPFFRAKRTKQGVYQIAMGSQMGFQPLGYGVYQP